MRFYACRSARHWGIASQETTQRFVGVGVQHLVHTQGWQRMFWCLASRKTSQRFVGLKFVSLALPYAGKITLKFLIIEGVKGLNISSLL